MRSRISKVDDNGLAIHAVSEATPLGSFSCRRPPGLGLIARFLCQCLSPHTDINQVELRSEPAAHRCVRGEATHND